jgi:hypothetical protein
MKYDLASLESVLLEGCQAPASFEAEEVKRGAKGWQAENVQPL